jgi:ankyrin repeat protein
MRGCGLFLGLSSGPRADEGDAMSGSLPGRPDLGQLRRRAKELRDAARRGEAGAVERFARHHPSAPPGAASLAASQLVIARELGFASWPTLRAAIDAGAASQRVVRTFVAASVGGRLRQASEIFGADPGIARRSLLAATVLGDAGTVAEMLAVDHAAAVAIDDERGWPPLLYACYSRWHQIDPGRAPGLAEVARLLLGAGASPATNDGGRPRYRSALKGSVEVNNPEVTAVLLGAGASPDPGQPIGEAVGHRDHRCLRLLLAHGARVAGTWAVGAAVYHDDPGAMALLLGALHEGGSEAARMATEVLPDAAARASVPVVAALLGAGADPSATDDDGVSALRLAVRAGKSDIAALLRAASGAEDGTDIDTFIGACLTADRRTASQLLTDHPDLPGRLTGQDRAVIVDAAGSRPAGAIALLLDLGFSPRARNDSGEQPLHTAAYYGNADAVRLLLEAGADVDAHDARFDSTPLAYATVGSGERAGEPGDWVTTVTLLIEAGATRRDVWLSGKPPSEEVRDLLQRYGITPDEPAGQQLDDLAAAPGAVGAGVMADIARHLEAAYRDADLGLLGSLLHPLVQWTGLCGNREQVLDWYQGLLAGGTVATVSSVEVDRDAVVLGLAVAGAAEGARPAPPQHLYQVFIVDGAQIIGIRGYPDRHSALTRAPAGPGGQAAHERPGHAGELPGPWPTRQSSSLRPGTAPSQEP